MSGYKLAPGALQHLCRALKEGRTCSVPLAFEADVPDLPAHQNITLRLFPLNAALDAGFVLGGYYLERRFEPGSYSYTERLIEWIEAVANGEAERLRHGADPRRAA